MNRRSNKSPHDIIKLRSVSISDAAFLLQMENDPSTWQYSSPTEAPYTLTQIEQFCHSMEQCSALPDADNQLRLIIELDNKPLGAVDMYDCDADQRYAKIAMIIYPPNLRSLGYGKQALLQTIEYCHSIGYDTLEAEISAQNRQSRNLFKSCGFALSHTTSHGVMIYTLNFACCEPIRDRRRS